MSVIPSLLKSLGLPRVAMNKDDDIGKSEENLGIKMSNGICPRGSDDIVCPFQLPFRSMIISMR
jgi:hypothetical protein